MQPDALTVDTAERVWRLCACLRVLSLFRCLSFVGQDLTSNSTRVCVAAGGRFARSLGPFLLYLAAVVHVYAVVGVHFFSGVDQQDKALLLGSDFSAQALYWEGLNFNDLSRHVPHAPHIIAHGLYGHYQ
jgi:hypothetical protein